MTKAFRIAPAELDRLADGMEPQLAALLRRIADGDGPRFDDLAEVMKRTGRTGRTAPRTQVASRIERIRAHLAAHGWAIVCDKPEYRYRLDRAAAQPVLPLRIEKGFGGNKQCFAVVDARGVQVSGAIAGIAVAEERRDALTAQAQRKVRRCMRCEQPFRSDGPHHRLCGLCRGADDGDWFGCGVVA